MFAQSGRALAIGGLVALLFWAAAAAGLRWTESRADRSPPSGVAAALPDWTTTVRAARILDTAFPGAHAKSEVGVLLARSEGLLTSDDYELADLVVKTLLALKSSHPALLDVLSYQNEVLGSKFVSQLSRHGQATLVLVQLANDFPSPANRALVRDVYRALDGLRARGLPAGLWMEVTGSAAMAADRHWTAEEGLWRVRLWAIALAAVILLLVAGSPLIVLVGLVVSVTALAISTDLVTLLGQSGLDVFGPPGTRLSPSVELLVTVLVLTLGGAAAIHLFRAIRSGFQKGLGIRDALVVALRPWLGSLGATLLAAALALATFALAATPEYRMIGPSVAIALVILLLVAGTAIPTLLWWGGGCAFWRAPEDASESGRASSTLVDPTPGQTSSLGDLVVARPWRGLVVALVILVPLAVIGTRVRVTFDVARDLDRDCPSMRGLQLLQRYFLPGELMPVTLVVRQPESRLDDEEGQHRIALLTRWLFNLRYPRPSGVIVKPILAVRSLSEPLGDPPGSRYNPFSPAGRQRMTDSRSPRVRPTYVAQTGPDAHQVTRLELIFPYEPFSRSSLDLADYLQRQLQRLSDPETHDGPPPDYPDDQSAAWTGAQFELSGPIPYMADRERIAGNDHRLLEVLAVLVVFGWVLIGLQRLLPSLVLLALGVGVGLAALGLTDLVWRWNLGNSYPGLQWSIRLPILVILAGLVAGAGIPILRRSNPKTASNSQEELPAAGPSPAPWDTAAAVICLALLGIRLEGLMQAGVALALGLILEIWIVRSTLLPALLTLVSRYRGWRKGREKATVA